MSLYNGAFSARDSPAMGISFPSLYGRMLTEAASIYEKFFLYVVCVFLYPVMLFSMTEEIFLKGFAGF